MFGGKRKVEGLNQRYRVLGPSGDDKGQASQRKRQSIQIKS